MIRSCNVEFVIQTVQFTKITVNYAMSTVLSRLLDSNWISHCAPLAVHKSTVTAYSAAFTVFRDFWVVTVHNTGTFGTITLRFGGPADARSLPIVVKVR